MNVENGQNMDNHYSGESKACDTMNISKEAPTPLTHSLCNMTNVPEFTLQPVDVPLNVLNFLFGFPTHSYVLWLIVTATERGITSEIFTLNISVCEIMFCVRCLTEAIATEFPRLGVLVIFMSGFVTTARFFQCLMCVERYLAVVHPVTFLKYKPLRYRVACCTFTWIMISLSCLISVQFLNLCYLRLFTCLYLSQFLVFLSIQLFCCVAVLRALKRSGPGERGREREEENHMKRRAFHLILITTVTLIITYVPGCSVTVLFLLSITAPQGLDSVCRACFMLAGFVQPLLYIHRVGKYPFCTTH